MDGGHLAGLLGSGRHDAAAALVAGYTIPLVTSLTEDCIVHDLALVEVLAGSFVPAGERVMIDVDAAYALMGWARAALLLYIGQPESVGAPLYDSGGKPVDGARVYPVASVNGEAAWAETTHRRLVIDVEPGRAVTWQVVPAIVGASATVDVAAPRLITMTPDGTKAFVTSAAEAALTPITLGRPGYSYDQALKTMDAVDEPVTVGASPTNVSCDDTHVVVSHDDAAQADVSIISVATHEIVRRVTVPGGGSLGSAIMPDGRHALVGTSAGRLASIDLGTGDVETAELGGRILAVGVLPDGTGAYAADADSATLYRVRLPDLTVEATVDLGHTPHVVRVAPDGKVWVLCRTPAPAAGRLLSVDPAQNRVVDDHELPFPEPNDFAIVPVEGQTFQTVRTAWIVYSGGRYSEFYIGGAFTGEVHSFHSGTLGEGLDAASAVAVNDFGEIWVVQPHFDRVWKWPGGRFSCRADSARDYNGIFFGEYCDVAVYGAVSDAGE